MTKHVKPASERADGPTVFIVDDDDAMRRGLEFLVRSVGYKVQSFASAPDFLNHYRSGMRGCVLLDVRMPEMSGEELHQRMQQAKLTIPVIIITAYANVPMAVRSLHAGAYDFIEKPFEDQVLLDRIRRAIEHDAETRVDHNRHQEIRDHLKRLTPRERDVMNLVVSGLHNHEIASMFGIKVKTVEDHRAAVMQKMEAHGLADLVRMATLIGMD